MSQAVIGDFETRQDVERALLDLREAGVDPGEISVLMQEQVEYSRPGAERADVPSGAITGAVTGGLLGGLAGWVLSLGVFDLAGVGVMATDFGAGATIMGALALGVERKTAAEFSFFVAVPTLIGASAYALYKSGGGLAAGELSDIAVGFAVSFLVAIAVIKAFVAIVSRHGFAPFAWYRIVVGAAALIWLAAR